MLIIAPLSLGPAVADFVLLVDNSSASDLLSLALRSPAIASHVS
jgi:hypothetical protein